MEQIQFNKGVVKPMECFREGWELIKDRYWLFFGVTAVGFIIASIVPFCIVLGAMMCGIYYPLFEKSEGRNVEFAQLFKGFEKFMPSLMATLPWAIPLQIVFLVAYIPLIFAQAMIQSKAVPPETVFSILIFSLVALLVVMIIWIFFHPFLMFVYQIITEHQISGWQALKLGFKSVWANLGGVVGLLVLNVLAYSLGALLCGIGAYFVLPLIFANTFVAYRKVFPKTNQQNFNNPPPPSAFNL
jgi:hypothetical protein